MSLWEFASSESPGSAVSSSCRASEGSPKVETHASVRLCAQTRRSASLSEQPPLRQSSTARHPLLSVRRVRESLCAQTRLTTCKSLSQIHDAGDPARPSPRLERVPPVPSHRVTGMDQSLKTPSSEKAGAPGSLLPLKSRCCSQPQPPYALCSLSLVSMLYSLSFLSAYFVLRRPAAS